MVAAAFNLTARQRAFVQQLARRRGSNAQAARDAGYSKINANVTASQLLARPDVQQAVILAQREQTMIDDEDCGVTKQYILGGIKRLIERCEQAEPVTDKNGDQVYERDANGKLCAIYAFRENAVLKGYEMLGKYKKLWTERIEVEDTTDHVAKLQAARRRVGLLPIDV